MIRFRFTVLLAFSTLPKPVQAKKGKDKGAKGKKGKKTKPEVEKPVVVKPPYLFEVGAPLGFAHIEYDFIPGRKCVADVVCWGPVAKVFTADGDVTMRTVLKNDKAWVPVTLRHVVNDLSDEELLKLHKHVVNYTIATSKGKLGPRAKADNTKAFFIWEKDLSFPEEFVEAFTSDPNLEEVVEEDEEEKRAKALRKDIEEIILECADAPGQQFREEVVSRLEFLKDKTHRHHIHKIINNVTAGREVELKEFAPTCPEPLTEEVKEEPQGGAKKGKGGKNKQGAKKDQKKKDKPKKEKKEKGGAKAPALFKIVLPGEVFFTDPILSVYDLKTPSADLPHAFVLATCFQLMKKEQKFTLNPLVIKIKKLSNLPVQVLKDHKFRSLYVHCNVPYIARCATLQKPLAPDIKFNESHAHFTNDVPKKNFLELLQSKRLYFEIHGVRDEVQPGPQPNLFGAEEQDKNISKRLSSWECRQRLRPVERPADVILAVACYDVSSLLQPSWDFVENASCHHPDAMLFQKSSNAYQTVKFVDLLTMNEVHFNQPKTKSASPLWEGMLGEHGTALKVEVYLSAPPVALLEVQTHPNVYRRMLVIIMCKELAYYFYNAITLHNQHVLGPAFKIGRFGTRPPEQMFAQTDADVLESWEAALTGFVVDNVNSFAFFLEGRTNGFITTVWEHLMYASTPAVKVFYNTNLCFEKRLYWDFFSYGGVYMVNLKQPLETICAQEKFYLEGNVPLPCWEALKKLQLLFQCKTLKDIMQFGLLPTAFQLISMDMEWGVPYKVKKVDPAFIQSSPPEPKEIKSEWEMGAIPIAREYSVLSTESGEEALIN